jgi:hypothetical protein
VSAPVTERMIDLCCAGRTRYGRVRAREVADARRAAGHNVSPYSCFSCGWWHVAHPPTMERVAEIALAIRDLHGNAPEPIGVVLCAS